MYYKIVSIFCLFSVDKSDAIEKDYICQEIFNCKEENNIQNLRKLVWRMIVEFSEAINLK